MDRYTLWEVQGNSFGDQVIVILDTVTEKTLTITNGEGSHQDVKSVIDSMNKEALLRKA